MLNIAIVGCGKIADAHAEIIQQLPNCTLVAVCDRELLMAQQLQERFGVKSSFDDLKNLLEEVKPDVVHITTPPQTHYDISTLCIKQGCHVYVEKPFTLLHEDALKLIQLAEKYDRQITVGHDAQFSPVSQRMRKHFTNDYLGDTAVHMEAYYGYELGGVYGNALLDNKNHWIRRLPGKLLHNIISHGIARITEHLESERPIIKVCGYTSPLLRSVEENEIIDELRVIICDNNERTAYFTFSSQIRPLVNQFRIFGSKNGLFMDETKQIFLKLKGTKYKSYAERFIPSLTGSLQYISNFWYNLKLFLKNDFHFESGKKRLIGQFYNSIKNNAEPPIPYSQILLTSYIMEEIFTQLSNLDEAR